MSLFHPVMALVLGGLGVFWYNFHLTLATENPEEHFGKQISSWKIL